MWGGVSREQQVSAQRPTHGAWLGQNRPAGVACPAAAARQKRLASPAPLDARQYVCALLVARSSASSGSQLSGGGDIGGARHRADAATDGPAHVQPARAIGDPGGGPGGTELGRWSQPA